MIGCLLLFLREKRRESSIFFGCGGDEARTLGPKMLRGTPADPAGVPRPFTSRQSCYGLYSLMMSVLVLVKLPHLPARVW